MNTSPRKKKPSYPQSKSPGKPTTTQSVHTPVNSSSNKQQQQYQLSTPVKHSLVEAGIDTVIAKQAVMLGFDPGPAWSRKVLQLYTITQIKHGMCL